MITENDWAYLAGLFDGEGSVGIYKRKDSPSPSVQLVIQMTDIKDLRDLYELFDAGFFFTFQRNGRKKIGVWKISKRSDLQEIIPKILPYSRVKRSQLELMLDYCELCDNQLSGQQVCSPLTAWDAAARISYVDQMKALKAPNL